MKMRDIMTRDLQTISPDATIQDASRKMKAFDVGVLPVCQNDQCVGIITDRDITIRATAEGRNPANTPVSEIMSRDVAYVSEEDDVSQAAKIMEDRQIRRILIFDQNRRPVGICSLGDLALDSGDLQLTGEVVHEVSRHGW